MKLTIFRHAWAGDAGDPRYPNDNLRPLTEDGKIRFRRFVMHLVKTREIGAQIILASPLVRCQQTAEILHDLLPGNPKITTTDYLALGANLAAITQQTNLLRLSDVIWVGHNPDVSMMSAALVGDRPHSLHFSKGTAAAIEFVGDNIIPGFGDLLWFESPKERGF